MLVNVFAWEAAIGCLSVLGGGRTAGFIQLCWLSYRLWVLGTVVPLAPRLGFGLAVGNLDGYDSNFRISPSPIRLEIC